MFLFCVSCRNVGTVRPFTEQANEHTRQAATRSQKNMARELYPHSDVNMSTTVQRSMKTSKYFVVESQTNRP